MTFEEANNLLKTKDILEDNRSMKAFNCTYFHNICIRCKNKPSCYRKEPFIKSCNFFEDSTLGIKPPENWRSGLSRVEASKE